MKTMVTVQQLMTQGVVTIGLDKTLEQARDLFGELGFHHLVVVDHERVVGVLSDRDLLENLSPFLGKFSERTADTASLRRRIHQAMTRNPVTVRPNTLALDAGRLMLDNNISCLPVLDADGGCAGILTIRDLTHWALACLEASRPRMAA